MYIGLYDQDLILGQTKVYPSIEMMLLSSYYKRDGIVELMFSLDDIQKYDLVYINRNRGAKDTLPPQIFTCDNVCWFGSGITGEFIPVEDKFYKVRPDKSLYEKYFSTHKEEYSARRKVIVKKILGPDYDLLKISQNGKRLIDYSQIPIGRKLIIFDQDLFSCEEISDIVLSLEKNQPFFLNRQRTDDFSIFKKCVNGNFKSLNVSRVGIVYDGSVTNSQFLSIYKNLNSNYGFGVEKYRGNESEENFIIRQFIQKGNFFMYCRAHGIQISIIDSNENHIKHPFSQILNRFCSFTQQTGFTTNHTFLTYLEKCGRIQSKELMKEFSSKNSQIYTILNTNLAAINRRGTWRL